MFNIINILYIQVNIWGKSIKNEIYKKSVNDFGYENYSKFFSWAEDTIMVFILLNTAQSFIFIHKYGVIHLIKYYFFIVDFCFISMN